MKSSIMMMLVNMFIVVCRMYIVQVCIILRFAVKASNVIRWVYVKTHVYGCVYCNSDSRLYTNW